MFDMAEEKIGVNYNDLSDQSIAFQLLSDNLLKAVQSGKQYWNILLGIFAYKMLYVSKATLEVAGYGQSVP